MNLKLSNDSLFLKRAASFSFLVELCKLREELNILKIDELLAKIKDFEQCLINNKEKDLETNDYAKFYNYLYQSTASKTARDFRGNMLSKMLLS